MIDTHALNLNLSLIQVYSHTWQ